MMSRAPCPPREDEECRAQIFLTEGLKPNSRAGGPATWRASRSRASGASASHPPSSAPFPRRGG